MLVVKKERQKKNEKYVCNFMSSLKKKDRRKFLLKRARKRKEIIKITKLYIHKNKWYDFIAEIFSGFTYVLSKTIMAISSMFFPLLRLRHKILYENKIKRKKN